MTITRPKSVHVLVGTPLDLDQEHSDDRVQWYYYPWSAGIAQQCALTKMPGGVPKPQYHRDAAYRYLTLSGRSHPRRDLLLKCLQYRDLLGHGLISRPMKNNAWQDINLDELDDIHDNDFKVWLDQTPGLPVHDYINCNHELTGIKRHWPGSQLLYQQCQWEIVNETQGAAHGNVYLSVNIFRSLLMGMPFVVNGSPGTLSALRDLGFQTFDSIINESYDTILDPVSRVLAVTTEIQKICDGSTVIDSDAVTQILIHNQTLALSLPHLQRVHDLLNHV
jgi:hypothetical protein